MGGDTAPPLQKSGDTERIALRKRNAYGGKIIKNKILVIDDEIGPRESLRILFKDTYDVMVAGNGEEGILVVKKDPPDPIILDLKMPGMDGIEVLQKIKAINPKAKVIILTGYGSPEAVIWKVKKTAKYRWAQRYWRSPTPIRS